MGHKKYTLYNTHNIISIEVEDIKENKDYGWKNKIKIFGITLRKEGFYNHGYIWIDDPSQPYYIEGKKLMEKASAWVTMSNNDFFIITGKSLEDVKRKIKNMMSSHNKMYYYIK